MTKEELRNNIEQRFPTRKAFLAAFHDLSGEKISPSELSHQFSGERGLSKLGRAAYTVFFTLYDQQQHEKT